MKKITVIILILMMVFGNTVGLAASGSDVAQPFASAFFTGYGTTLSNSGNCVIKIIFSATGTEICDEIGVANFMVQRYDEGLGWYDLTGLVPGQTGEDMMSYTYSLYFQGVEDEIYRVQVVFTSTIDGRTEYKSYTSGAIRCRQNAN